MAEGRPDSTKTGGSDQITLRRGLSLFDITMIGAGIFVLTGKGVAKYTFRRHRS